MPAGPIGACWASGSWSDTAWEENTWSGAVTPVVQVYPFDVMVCTGLVGNVDVLTEFAEAGSVRVAMRDRVDVLAALEANVDVNTEFNADVNTRARLAAIVRISTET